MSEAAAESVAAPLPEPVRARVVALAAAALADLPAETLPASLRPVAGFTPRRRARLAGTQIAAALETHDDFRAEVASRVRASAPQVAAALDAGSPPPAADPVEVAAIAYLLRPPGWAEVVASASRRAHDDYAVTEVAARAQTVDRLRQQLEQARVDARAARGRARDRVAGLKRDNAALRHRLAEVRAQLKQAQHDADTARRRLEELRAEAESDDTQVDAELRRLRGRVAELEAEASAARRAEREHKEHATVRARLLLDTLLETAKGLRRELALPPVTTLPADTVGAVHPGPAGAAADTGRALSVDDPALLEQLVALPRAHLVVDGYNVTKTGWSDLSLEQQRGRLLAGLGPLAARSGAEVTVVFDGADLAHPPPVGGPRNVRVRFSRPGTTADDLVRELVAAEPVGRPVVVASSDREVVDAVTASGARAVAAAALVRLVKG